MHEQVLRGRGSTVHAKASQAVWCQEVEMPIDDIEKKAKWTFTLKGQGKPDLLTSFKIWIFFFFRRQLLFSTQWWWVVSYSLFTEIFTSVETCPQCRQMSTEFLLLNQTIFSSLCAFLSLVIRQADSSQNNWGRSSLFRVLFKLDFICQIK